MATIHKVKIKQEYAKAYYEGLKPWEIRKNDRGYKVGDTIEFEIIEIGGRYQREILYLFEGGEYGLEEGYCIMTLSGYEYVL